MTFKGRGVGTITYIRSETDNPWIYYYVIVKAPDGQKISATITKGTGDEPPQKGDSIGLVFGNYFWELVE